MARSRLHRSSKNVRKSHATQVSQQKEAPEQSDPPVLLVQAAELLHTGQPELALHPAQQAVSLLSSASDSSQNRLPALSLLGEIQIELGDVSSALKTFEAAVSLDPDGRIPEEQGGGAEKFLWMAQLCETGGRDSIRWYQKGVDILERDASASQEAMVVSEEQNEKKQKIATALGAMVEVWMTDLSFDFMLPFHQRASPDFLRLEPEAEQECERLIQRSLQTIQPPSSSTLQTLASIRLSQSRLGDAQSALTQSLGTWKDLPPGHSEVPDFALRISLSRLLMEAEMEDEALEVLERLVGEDDESVEAWYLGGWCLWLLGNQSGQDDAKEQQPEMEEGRQSLLLSSREWLRNCLKLYGLLSYGDERLHEHATELVHTLDEALGEAEIEELDEEAEWVDEDESPDEGDENERMDMT